MAEWQASKGNKFAQNCFMTIGPILYNILLWMVEYLPLDLVLSYPK